MDVGILYDFGWLVCIQATMNAGRIYIYIITSIIISIIIIYIYTPYTYI
jgi:hypothetical protein